MPSAAIAAYGTLLQRGSLASGTTPNTYVTIGDVKSISGPTTEVAVIDVTTHSSAVAPGASSSYREKIPSLIDPGEVTFDLNWNQFDATQKNLYTDMTTRTKRDWRVLGPVGGASQTYITFAGYVTGFPLDFPTDDVQSGSVTITITGAVTIAP